MHFYKNLEQVEDIYIEPKGVVMSHDKERLALNLLV